MFFTFGDKLTVSFSFAWQQNEAEVLVPNYESKRKGNCGRKSKLTPAVVEQYTAIAQEYADLHIRLNSRLLKDELSTHGTEVAHSTIQRHLKGMKAVRKNLRLKPTLTDDQKWDRMSFVIDRMDRSHGLDRATHTYKPQLDTVHVDESWFYLRRVNNQILYFEGVDVPNAPTAQHKNHIPKVMFLVAMARPQVRPDGTVFDGKIGLWPCIEIVPAKKNSKNRPAGTPEIKTRNVDAEYYRSLFTMEGGVIDKIKEKMPWMHNQRVKIQQDGAGGHGKDSHTIISATASTGGWHFRVYKQCAQSPDLNILDLGFFHSLKTRVAKIKFRANNLEQMIAQVRQAFAEYPPDVLDHIWGHLFAV